MPSNPSGFVLRAFPSASLPMTIAGRYQWVMEMASPRPILDEDGEPTGEYTTPLISKRTARRLLDAIEISARPVR